MKNKTSGILLPVNTYLPVRRTDLRSSQSFVGDVSLHEMKTLPADAMVLTRWQNNFKWISLPMWETPPANEPAPKNFVKVKCPSGEVTLHEDNFLSVSLPRFEITEQNEHSDVIWCPVSKLKTGNNLLRWSAPISGRSVFSESPVGKIKHFKQKDSSPEEFLRLYLPIGYDNLVLSGGFIVK